METIKKTSEGERTNEGTSIVAQLNAPLPPEAVSQHPTKPYLSTIKAIYVVERFNQVFGLGGWYIHNEVVDKVEVPTKSGTAINIVVKSTFHADKYDIVIPDIFGGNDNPDLGDAYKGACTDALTKIGSYLGVGMDVYKGLADKKPSQTQNSAPQATKTTPASKVPKTMANGANTPNYEAKIFCPVHGATVIHRPKGVTKQGKKYGAFYACSVRENDQFCKEGLVNEFDEEVDTHTGEPKIIQIDEPPYEDELPPFK